MNNEDENVDVSLNINSQDTSSNPLLYTTSNNNILNYNSQNIETILLDLLDTYETSFMPPAPPPPPPSSSLYETIFPLPPLTSSSVSLNENATNSDETAPPTASPTTSESAPSTASSTTSSTASSTAPESAPQSPITMQYNSTLIPPPPRLRRRNNGPFNRRIPINSSSLLRNLFSPQQQTTFNDILNNSLNDPTQDMYKNVLSEEGEKTIKYLKYCRSEFQDQPTCMITLNDFKDDDDIVQLPCKHIFQKEGILNWLKNEDSRCPVCRKELPSKEEKKIISEPSRNQISRTTNTRITPRSLLMNFIDNQVRREEEQDLQDAIFASLLETNTTPASDTESGDSNPNITIQ